MNLYLKHISYTLSCLIILTIVFSGCAKMGSLSGGPKDLRPPELDVELSDKNFQTNYYPKTIELYFDEWILLKNKSQILISPPLAKNPEVNDRGKKVEVVFDEEEVLRDSTTYAINFGNAIVDFTESNPVSNFRFVFSTGDKIDSLVILFNVKDAYTGKAVKDVSVMLYDMYQDSVVYYERPYYFAKTDKSGNCTIQNLRAGTFKCFALLDSNFDFLYNDEQEEIGFPDSLIMVRPDSFVQRIEIELFQPRPKLQLTEMEIVRKGKIKILPNKTIDSIELLSSNMNLFHTEFLKDSVIYWYDTDTFSIDSIQLVFDLEGTADTSILKSKNKTPGPAQMDFSSFKSRKLKVNPGNPLKLIMNQPVFDLDTSKFSLEIGGQKLKYDTLSMNDTLIIDTIVPEPVYLPFDALSDSSDIRNIIIHAAYKEAESYILTLFPGAITGYYENSNDTLISEFSLELSENLGNIYCIFDSLDIDQQYVVFLKQKDRVFDQAIIYGSESATVNFLQQQAGKYYLEVIVDDNRNGRWDPGNYELKKQSERTLEIQLDELRKGWDLETEIKWDGP